MSAPMPGRTANELDDVFHHDWGVAHRSQFRVLAPLHILRREGQEWRTWCTGAPGLLGKVHPLQPVCKTCRRLAREEAAEYGAKG